MLTACHVVPCKRCAHNAPQEPPR